MNYYRPVDTIAMGLFTTNFEFRPRRNDPDHSARPEQSRRLAVVLRLLLLLALRLLHPAAPLRDEMGVQRGVANLPRLFSVTFATMLLTVPVFGFAAARLPRRRLVP